MPSQVLIVDDDSAIRELLREFLAEEGLATSEAASNRLCLLSPMRMPASHVRT